MLAGVILLLSNLCATKLFNFFGISVDAGVIIYPLSYVIGDVLIMISPDKRIPRIILWVAFAANLMAAGVFYFAIKLPAFEGWENQEAFETIFGFAPRVILASLAAFISSGLINILAFRRLGDTKKGLFLRAFGSSAVAKAFDILIFELVAFLGVLTIEQFIVQTIFAYGIGLLLEIPLSALACALVKIFKLQPEKVVKKAEKPETT